MWYTYKITNFILVDTFILNISSAEKDIIVLTVQIIGVQNFS